jgi:tetratricopeptide (TPR) repeat protein
MRGILKTAWKPALLLGALIVALLSITAGASCRQENWHDLRHRACGMIARVPALPDPIVVWALNNRGLAFYETGRQTKALANFERAVQRDPSNPRVHNNTGNVYRKLNQLPEAEARYSLAVRGHPGYGRGYFNRGMVRWMMGHLDAALVDINRAVELQPAAASPLTVRGNIKLLKGDLAGALQDHTRAVALAPNFTTINANRGCVLMAQRRIASATLDVLASHRPFGNETSSSSRWRSFAHTYAHLRLSDAAAQQRAFTVQISDFQSVDCALGLPIHTASIALARTYH